MTCCSTYIGDLDDPKFNFNVFKSGNLPCSLAPDFPSVGRHYNGPFHEWVKARQIPVKETDHSGYVAQVTKAQLEDYIEFAYGSEPSYNDPAHMLMWDGVAYLVKQLDEVKAVVAHLDAQKFYALVAECD
ncbi:MAG TPA: hypothetical protein VFF81_04290 [Noviherbaspirillum sp.]|nr:hypothetical protein [Noviherbaspirillum sp.]